MPGQNHKYPSSIQVGVDYKSILIGSCDMLREGYHCVLSNQIASHPASVSHSDGWYKHKLNVYH